MTGQGEAISNGDKRVYYFVGPPGVGKSYLSQKTPAKHHIREWHSEPPINIYNDPVNLNQNELCEIDSWIMKELTEKTRKIREIPNGTVIVDRSPMDVIAFPSKHENMVERAKKYNSFYFGESSKQENLPISGEIIHLRTTLDGLMSRREGRGDMKKLQYDSVERAERDLKYDHFVFDYDLPGLHHVDTNDTDISQAMEKILLIIHSKSYAPIDFKKHFSFLINEIGIKCGEGRC